MLDQGALSNLSNLQTLYGDWLNAKANLPQAAEWQRIRPH